MGKNETKFYKCFQNIIGEEYLKSKSVDRKISKDDIFLSSNYRDYSFDDNTVSIIEEILKEFNSNLNIPSISLVSYIDGMIVNHPKLRNRIVEFDEEQHFSPYRQKALVILKEKNVDLGFIENYLELCKDIKHFTIMLKKHRIKYKTDKIIPFNEFNNILTDASNNSNYIKQRVGFDFVGGRIAQRAYYDMLRDLAYLSPKNTDLKQIIRFSKYEIEKEFQNKFEKLSNEEIGDFIKRRLKVLM